MINIVLLRGSAICVREVRIRSKRTPTADRTTSFERAFERITDEKKTSDEWERREIDLPSIDETFRCCMELSDEIDFLTAFARKLQLIQRQGT